MKRRLLASILSLVMVLSLLPTAALADGGDQPESTTLRMKVGETRTVTFDSGMEDLSSATSTEQNANVTVQSVFTEADAPVTGDTIPDGYYYIKGTRNNNDPEYWSDIFATVAWADQEGMSWLQYSNDPTIYQVTKSADGQTYSFKDCGQNNSTTQSESVGKYLSSQHTELVTATSYTTFQIASMGGMSEDESDSAFTITQATNSTNQTIGHAVSVGDSIYINSLGGYDRALLYKTAATDQGSVMNFYKVGYTTTVTVEATQTGISTITVDDRTIEIVVSADNAFQDIYVGAGQSTDVTVATENSYTNQTIFSSDALRVTATGSQVQLGDKVEFSSDLADGTYVLQDQRSNSVAVPDQRYLTDEIKHVSSYNGRDVITQSAAANAGVYTFASNSDGTYSVKTSNGYLDTKTITMDSNGAAGLISSVAWKQDASNSAVTLVGNSTDSYMFGLKTKDTTNNDAMLASWGGYQYSMWANYSSPVANDGTGYYLYPATVKTTLRVDGRVAGDYEVVFDNLTLRIHVVDAVRVPVMGSVSVPCSENGEVQLSGNLNQYVTATANGTSIIFENSSATGLTVGEILTGTATVGSTVFSVSIGIDESVEMAAGTSKTFVYKDDAPVVSKGLTFTSENKNKATLVESVSDIRDGGEYLIAGMRIQTVADSEEINWTTGSRTVYGLKKLSSTSITNDTEELDLASNNMDSARFRFEKVGENTYNLFSVATGKYLKSDGIYSLSLTPYQSDASKVTVAANLSADYGNGLVYLGVGANDIGDWGGNPSQGLTVISKGSNGTELKLFAAEDNIATVTANGDGYVTVDGKTYQINVFNRDDAAAELNGTLYTTVQAAASAAKSGDTIVLKNTTGTEETVEIPVGVTVKSSDAVIFADAYYNVKNGEEIAATIPVKSENGKAILFLPSSARNVELTAANLNLQSNVTLTVNDSQATATLNVDSVTLTKTFTVAKAGNISSVFVSGLEKEGNKDVAADINWINASKSNAGVGGQLYKVDPDGKVSVQSGVKKMKGRGNTSWGAATDGNAATDKKPYNITLNGEESLVDGAAEAKKWCLIANNYADFSGVNNYMAYTMYQEMDGNSAMKCEPVDLYVNGEYRGIYLVTDKVEIGEDRVNVPESKYSTVKGTPETQARVIVDGYDSYFNANGSVKYWENAKRGAVSTAKADDPALNAGVLAYAYASEQTQNELNGGYILEISHQYTDEAGWFITNHGVMISFKEPERPTQAQVQAAAIYVQEFEDALYSETGYNSLGKHYSEYLDLESFAKTYLLSCFTGQNDMLDCSDYLNLKPTYKDGKIAGGKLMGGPAWDYDVSQYNIDKLYADKSSTNVNGNQAWISQLLKRGDFTDALYQLKQGAFADAVNSMKTKVTEYGTKVADSLAMDQLMWNRTTSAQQQFNTQSSRFNSRITSWNTVWSDAALKGVSVMEEVGSGTLTATANTNGTASYQWYKVDETDKTKMTACDGATESTFVPTEAGTYLVKVTGTAMKGKDVPDTMYSAAITVDGRNPAAEWTNYIKSNLGSTKVPGSDMEYSKVPEIQTAIEEGDSDIREATTKAGAEEALEASKANLLNVVKNYVKDLADTVYNNGNPTVLNGNSYTVSEADYNTAVSGISDASDVAGVLDAYNTMLDKQVCRTISSVSIESSKDSMVGSGTVTLTVTKTPAGADVTVSCNDSTVTVKDNGNGTYTVTLPNTTKTYTFTASIEQSKTYTDASDTCTVSVTRYVPSNPGSSVTVPATANGSVTVSPSTASKGTTVTVTTKPNEGYELGSLEVLDKNGNALALKDLGNGKYSFTMPDGKVTVNADFVKASVSTGFADVPANAYYADAVKWAVDKGVTNGLSDTLFGPYEPCTRAQIVTFLWRAAGSPEPKTTTSKMTDLDPNAYYYKAVLWAIENGITAGMTDTTFAPNATCTRGQSVTFLYRALGKKASSSANFSDVAANAFYADAVNWAVENNVTNGTSATTFSPNADCTRAEIVTFLYRAYQGK